MTGLLKRQISGRLKPAFLTFAIITIYAAVMICTNGRFTILDDEANFIAAAAQPPLAQLHDFFTGSGLHELHPPTVTILLHLWLVATHYSFFGLRIFANFFFIAAAYCTARTAKRIGGELSYWWTLCIAFAWPFAFEYGRVTHWFGCAMLLLSIATWAYLVILEDRGSAAWWVFGTAALLLVWCIYFGFVFLFLLLADLLLFHRKLARLRWPRLLAVFAVIFVGYLPLLPPALANIAHSPVPVAIHAGFSQDIAAFGYAAFGIFASVAVAPWYWPLSIPVALAIAAIVVAMWPSPGRRWFIYFALTMVVLELSGQMTIKRVVFLLTWLFLSIGLAASIGPAWSRASARLAATVIILCGFIGIASGRHYATTNFYEPWANVAQVVAHDARSGATVVSRNPPFFLYLDYQLRLQGEVGSGFAHLGSAAYATHGYKVLESDADPAVSDSLRGKVVVVKGPSVEQEVESLDLLDAGLRRRCRLLGEYRAAPDPAAALKARFMHNVAVMTYRTDVLWYDCP